MPFSFLHIAVRTVLPKELSLEVGAVPASKRRNAIQHTVGFYYKVCGAKTNLFTLYSFFLFSFISTRVNEHYQTFHSVSNSSSFCSFEQKSEFNKSIRTTSILFKQSLLPVTHNFKSLVRLQRIRIRSYASSSMTSPTIKLNSGHQMPLVGFGRVAIFKHFQQGC